MPNQEEVRGMQDILDKMNAAASGNPQRPAHLTEAAQEVPGTVSNDAIEMYNILKRLQDATQNAAEKVVVKENTTVTNELPLTETAPTPAPDAQESNMQINMEGYSIKLHEQRLEGKYKKTYYTIMSSDNVLFKDIALFESAMAIMKNLVFKKHAKIATIMTLDNRYAQVLEEAAHHKAKMQPLKESTSQFDISAAKHSMAVSKMKDLKTQIKKLL